MKTTLPNNKAAATWLTTSQVAIRLGCHRNTARAMAEAGDFPGAIKLKRDWRIPASDVDSYINRRTR